MNWLLILLVGMAIGAILGILWVFKQIHHD